MNQKKEAETDLVRLRAEFTIPGIVRWQAKRLLNSLKKDYADRSDVDFSKAEGMLDSLFSRNTINTNTGQNPTFSLCPTIRATPYWDKGDSDFFDRVSADLQNNFDKIMAEYNQVSKQGAVETVSNAYSGEMDPKDWMRFSLAPSMSFGKFTKQGKQQFPFVTTLLEKYGVRLASAAFYAMAPGVSLPAHTDATNFFIVSHMGMNVPDNCAFQVAGEIRELQEKDVVFFDQSFTHLAWNKSDLTRINLVLFFVHPDISDTELELVLKFRDRIKRRVYLLSPFILMQMFFNKLFKAGSA